MPNNLPTSFAFWYPKSSAVSGVVNGSKTTSIPITIIPIPIAEALFTKGALLGSVLSFMMAVTTLSLPSMIMLRKAVKPKLLALFIAICTVGIILVGYLFNLIQPLIA